LGFIHLKNTDAKKIESVVSFDKPGFADAPEAGVKRAKCDYIQTPILLLGREEKLFKY
jgi:hypothetical protein